MSGDVPRDVSGDGSRDAPGDGSRDGPRDGDVSGDASTDAPAVVGRHPTRCSASRENCISVAPASPPSSAVAGTETPSGRR
eukprot:scaffold7890_cov112-Isochrysis_galbana.AAC.9